MSKYFRKKVLMSKLCKTMLSFISQVRRLHPTLRVSNQLPDREGSACKAINCELHVFIFTFLHNINPSSRLEGMASLKDPYNILVCL